VGSGVENINNWIVPHNLPTKERWVYILLCYIPPASSILAILAFLFVIFENLPFQHNELLFISIALKLNQNFMDSLMIPSRGSNATPPLILLKIHTLENSFGWDRIFMGVKFNFIGFHVDCLEPGPDTTRFHSELI
jgi:hypothetical protein